MHNQVVPRDEWLNARGAIARFGRGTIEIRVLDVQECPQADLAICAAVVEVLQALVAEDDHRPGPVRRLAVFRQSRRQGPSVRNYPVALSACPDST